MKLQQILLSEAAVADILEQADWYEQESGIKLAQRWEKAVTKTMLRVAQRPLSGPLCHFRPAELADIRRVAVDQFPKHLIFYRRLQDRILIVRIIHGARDLESLL